MNLNSISINNTLTTQTTTDYYTNSKRDSTLTHTDISSDTAAVYEKSEEKYYTINNPDLIRQLREDALRQVASFKSLVERLMLNQGTAYTTYNDMIEFIAQGEYTVDEATIAKAKEDISEDGYWGVDQTSDRIISFAQGLAGDNKELLAKMKDSFIEAYRQAEESWGGTLPEISKQTYDAVTEKFDTLLSDRDNEVDIAS